MCIRDSSTTCDPMFVTSLTASVKSVAIAAPATPTPTTVSARLCFVSSILELRASIFSVSPLPKKDCSQANCAL